MLTDRERTCLRLVARGRSSKEIGAELGISHHTVDLYLKRAIKTLQASSRRDAARQLEILEESSNQGLVTQPAGLAEPGPMPAISPPIRMESYPRFRVPFLRQGRQYNDLST
ncbi:helix-turn-helix transcriptional regulator, partial [Sphingomonas sp. 28-63-12]|uniref:helix-turn-helix domain-containing protein n=1 Tax=Sphingomonas sp. 28-63-12 TaxID=1970434 RepID=UPI0035A8D0D7